MSSSSRVSDAAAAASGSAKPTSAGAALAAAKPVRKAPLATRFVDDDEDEDKFLAPDDVQTKADWKHNPFVPIGLFGSAVALGVGIVYSRRNSQWGMSQIVMQARVIAQAACVAGLAGGGLYATLEQKKHEKLEAARLVRK